DTRLGQLDDLTGGPGMDISEDALADLLPHRSLHHRPRVADPHPMVTRRGQAWPFEERRRFAPPMTRPYKTSFLEAKTWMPGSRLRQGYAGPRTHSAAEALAKAASPGIMSCGATKRKTRAISVSETTRVWLNQSSGDFL